MTSSVAGLRRSSKALLKAKLPPKKWSCSLFGGLLPVWSTRAFWIPVKPLHLRSMLSKPLRCTKNWNTSKNYNTYSWHWSTERAQFFSMQCPIICCKTNASEGEQMFIWPLTNRLPLLQASWQIFSGKMLSQPEGGRKWFPRVHQILKQGFLYYRKKQIYFSSAKMCWL